MSMDAKEVKSCLKGALEAIRESDFKEALKHCKAVLAVDKENYNALVFMGKAAEGLQQPDQGLKAYRRAAENQPDQLLAWQGLASIVDKNPELMAPEEIITTYQKLLNMSSSDVKKQILYCHKLADLYIKINDTQKALQTLVELLELEKESEGRMSSYNSVINILSPMAPHLSKEHLDLYEEALTEILQSSVSLSPVDQTGFVEKLLLLTSQISVYKVPALAASLKEKFPLAPAPTEYILRHHLDSNIGNGSISSETCTTVKELMADLSKLKPDSNIILIAQGFTAFVEKQFDQALALLEAASVYDEVSGLYYLSRTYLELHKNSQCLGTSIKGLAKLNSKCLLCASCDHVMNMFKLVQAEALREISTPESQEQALTLLEELSEKIPLESFLIKAYIYLDQGELAEAEICVRYLPQEPVSVQTLNAMILMHKKDYVSALKILESIVNNDPTDFRATLKLGQLFWEMRLRTDIDNVKQKCFAYLLKAAKLDPNYYESFLYLGFYYKENQDDVKARKCFQKAYDLNHNSELAACALVDSLVQAGDDAQSLKILETTTSQAAAGCAKWAWLRLGLYQIKHENPSKAIMSLQSALRADPNDNHVWECLAEAYLQRGSLTAALKAFAKSSELDTNSLYSLYKIANIKHLLGSLSEAVEEYKEILKKSPNYIPVLKGVAESLIHLGKKNLDSCLDGLAQDHFEEAILYLTKAAGQRPDMSCLWKLLGDACTQVVSLASDTYSVPVKLLGKVTSDLEVRTVNKMELLKIGARCYSQAVKILPESGALWHDLSISLYHQSQLLLSLDSVAEGLQLLEKSCQAVKKALVLEPNNWRHWNALGVIACCSAEQKPALAQHCFIKSIECESSNVTAWTNLGVFYLANSEIQLAHNAFKAAQSIDPTYMACWVGQALIAEIVGHEEAMDLFRHTTELGFHLESAIGYGQWVLDVLGDVTKRETSFFHFCIQQMAALPAACDALTRYTCRIKTDPVALNMLGLLYEHQNLLQSAVNAFREAVKLLDIDDPLNHSVSVKLNLARLLCKQGKSEESVSLFKSCDLSSNVEQTCQLGLALFKCHQFSESYRVYKDALSMSEGTAYKSEICTALGMLAYIQGDTADAKAKLFDGFQTSAPSPHVLLAVSALGLLQQDMTLASAGQQELFNREDQTKFTRDITLLQLYTYLLEGHVDKAIEWLQELEQGKPELWPLWEGFVSYFAEQKDFSHLISVVDHLCQVYYGGSELTLKENTKPIHSQETLLGLVQLLHGHHHRQVRRKNALVTAQKAFHTNPGSRTSLMTLVCALHAEGAIGTALTGSKQMFRWEQSILGSLLDTGDLSEELEVWCLQLLVVCCIEAADEALLNLTLSRLEKKQSLAVEFLKSIKAFLSQEADVNPSGKLPLLVSCALSYQSQNFENATQILKHQSHDNNLLILRNLLERKIQMAYHGLKDQLNNAILSQSIDEAIETLKTNDIKSTIALVFEGLRAEGINDKRRAKHLFATALDHLDVDKEIGYCSSFIRQRLLANLADSAQDKSLRAALLDDARTKGDTTTLTMFDELVSK
ncbi:superkiller complex protein 3-like isoform X2 [Physella acuta]|nr:superkiller complex protein 3-like isoform X2 [Physella acuta]XP_059178472.1 superkiller complex protein 3-like isoform X2 [Physella acuta]